ncbi:MAG: cupin domain-containing protein [Pseudomonadota bacterium]
MTALNEARMLHKVIGADDVCGPSERHWISKAGGLTQFGAFIETLPPGSRSALKHWHAAEDEMVFVLEGEVTLIEDDAEIALVSGMAATFPAGAPVGHLMENRSAAPVRYLVVGTSAAADRVTYPDHGRVYHRDGEAGRWTDLAGRPATNPYTD